MKQFKSRRPLIMYNVHVHDIEYVWECDVYACIYTRACVLTSEYVCFCF